MSRSAPAAADSARVGDRLDIASVDPCDEHHASRVRVPVGDAAVRLPIGVLLGGWLDAVRRKVGNDVLLGADIGQVEHQLVELAYRPGGLLCTDNLQMGGAV